MPRARRGRGGTDAGRLFRGEAPPPRSAGSSRASSSSEGAGDLDADSLPPASPLPSPPRSLLAELGGLSRGGSAPCAQADVPQWRRMVQHGRGYANEERLHAYARVTECGGGGDFSITGILPLEGLKGSSCPCPCAPARLRACAPAYACARAVASSSIPVLAGSPHFGRVFQPAVCFALGVFSPPKK